MYFFPARRRLKLICLFVIAFPFVFQVVSANDDIPHVRILNHILEVPPRSESEILASQILIRQGTDGFRLPERFQQLATEIQQVLELVRESEPSIADVSVSEAYSPGAVIVTPQPGLLKRVQSMVGSGAESVPFSSGSQKFDQFNAKFGLYAVNIYSQLNLMILYYDPGINPQFVSFLLSSRYSEHVKSAEPDYFLGDRSAIKVSKAGENWYVLFRRAWGDCPSGCINQELNFFMVKENHVKSIPFEEARTLVEFVMLLDSLRRESRPMNQLGIGFVSNSENSGTYSNTNFSRCVIQSARMLIPN